MALGKWWFISEPRANSQINPSHQKTSAFFQHHQVALGAERNEATTSGCGGIQLGAMGLLGPPVDGQQASCWFGCATCRWRRCSCVGKCARGYSSAYVPFCLLVLGPRFGFRGVSVLCIMRISTSHCSDFRDARILNLAETRWNALLGQMGQLAVDLEGLEPGITLKDHWWVHCTARHSKAFVGHDVFRGPGPRYEGTTAQHRKKKMGRFQNRHPIFRRRFWPPTHIGFWMFREHITIFLWQVERHPVL